MTLLKNQIDRKDILDQIESIRKREEIFWSTSQAFLDNRDAHGLHDMGVELQALERSRRDLEKLLQLPA